MSELHEPITDLPQMLLLPAERDLSPAVRQRQQQVLMAQIAGERSAAAASLVGRLLAQARALAARFGLLVLLIAAGCLLGSSSSASGKQATRALEITAVAGSATVLALSAARVERSGPDGGSAIRFRLSELRRLGAQPNF
jgi:hypothetical protein